jgi:VanZ family protein
MTGPGKVARRLFWEPSMTNRWFFLFWATLLAVLILSLLPAVTELPGTGWDKTNHLFAFALLFILGRKSYPWPDRLFLGLILFGGLIEVLQSFTTYRYAEWADLLADVLGLLLGAWLHRLLPKLQLYFQKLR